MTENTKIDKLRICLIIVSMILFVIGVFAFFTQSNEYPINKWTKNLYRINNYYWFNITLYSS